jgi:hypothetical protein
MKKSKVNKDQALILVAQYILDEKEREDYIDQCDFYDIDPKDLQGEKQRKHVYALALIGLSQKFE